VFLVIAILMICVILSLDPKASNSSSRAGGIGTSLLQGAKSCASFCFWPWSSWRWFVARHMLSHKGTSLTDTSMPTATPLHSSALELRIALRQRRRLLRIKGSRSQASCYPIGTPAPIGRCRATLSLDLRLSWTRLSSFAALRTTALRITDPRITGTMATGTAANSLATSGGGVRATGALTPILTDFFVRPSREKSTCSVTLVAGLFSCKNLDGSGGEPFVLGVCFRLFIDDR